MQFLVVRIQEEYLAKQKKFYMCFADLEKAFDRVPRKVVERAMRKKVNPKALVRAVMSLYKVKSKKKLEHLYLKSLR